MLNVAVAGLGVSDCFPLASKSWTGWEPKADRV